MPPLRLSTGRSVTPLKRPNIAGAKGLQLDKARVLPLPKPEEIELSHSDETYGVQVSFDDLASELVIDPFLTVADQPAYEMGQQATELLIARLSDSASNEFKEIVLPTEVIVRRSCGPLNEPGAQSSSEGLRDAAELHNWE